MKKKIKFLTSILLLFLLPVFTIGASPQSFFISPGQVINDGTIARAYCLEYSKDVLRASNLTELTRMIGDVIVTYNNGNVLTTSFQELYKSGRVGIIPHNSYEHMQIVFSDKSIKQIQIGQEGLGLYREKLEEHEKKLTQINIQKILELEALGKFHAEIQRIIWRTRTPRIFYDENTNEFFIDLMTTDNEEEKVYSTFKDSATVSYTRDGRTFLRLDGLLGNNENNIEQIIELISHYHRDHITRSRVEQTLQEGNFNRIIGPNPALDESRNSVFDALNEEYRRIGIEHETQILDITNSGEQLNLKFTPIGDFIHSSFRIDKDTVVEMFKYQNPLDPNHDGFIYQISHKNVKQLLFGDFDDIDGIENLLDASAANEKRYYESNEKISNLKIQRFEVMENIYELRNRIAHYEYMLEIAKSSDDVIIDFEEQQKIEEHLNSLNNSLKVQRQNILRIVGYIKRLEYDIQSLPFLKADIIKWPHHAHTFTINDRIDNVIIKLNDVVDPQYIIWQRYGNQSDIKFEIYIERFPFQEKCLSSDKMEIIIISLEWLKTWGLS